MEHSNLPPRSEDLIAGIVQAATESLPHQPDVLAKARALFGPLLDKLPLPSGESTLAHADGVAKIIAYIGGADNLQAVTYMLYAAEHLNRPQEVIEQAFGEEYATLAMQAMRLTLLQRNQRLQQAAAREAGRIGWHGGALWSQSEWCGIAGAGIAGGDRRGRCLFTDLCGPRWAIP